MKRRLVLLLVLPAASMVAPGCMTGAKEVRETFRGGTGIHVPVQPVAPSRADRPLGAYTRFELGAFEDGMGGKVPSDLYHNLKIEFEKQLSDSDLPNRPDGKTLVIRGRIVHYESEGLVGIVMGPLEEVVARTELYDPAADRVLGTANCIGRTKGRFNTGVKTKAEGLAKAIIGWIKSRYPEKD